jgi:hypothetical protein
MTQVIDFFSVLAHVATAIGVGIGVYQLRITRKQVLTTFEDGLAAQYRQVASTLPVDALLGQALTNDAHEQHLSHFYRYFDLCNEQAFLHKNGRVSASTWAFWEDGILTNFRRPAFARAWNEIAARVKEDFDELRLLCPPVALPTQASAAM